MANNVIILLLSIVLCISAGHGRKTLNSINSEDDNGICKSMVETQGYKCQEHKVTTQDGYILSLQRMPAGRSSNKTAYKPPVLLVHGILVDANAWLFNSPKESLPFILVDNGYDVWLANTRGTKYGSGHTSLSPHDKPYWEWSWDDLAAYDLPASVQYVYNQTGQKLHYVGHSLGTLIALTDFSQKKLLNMVRSAALLSPIAHMTHIPSEVTKIAADIFLADELYWLGLRKIIPGEQAATKLVELICHIPLMPCSNLLTMITGSNCCLNSSIMSGVFEREPQPTSTKNLIHLAQMIRKGRIAKYDYGHPKQNMEHYGHASPPLYDMKNIPNDFPLFLGYGGKDALSDLIDVQILLGDFKNHDKDKLVRLFKEDYAHIDFIMGVNANQVVYDPMMAFFEHN